MGLRTVALAEGIVISDIATREMVKVEIEDVDRVETWFGWFREQDMNRSLRLQG